MPPEGATKPDLCRRYLKRPVSVPAVSEAAGPVPAECPRRGRPNRTCAGRTPPRGATKPDSVPAEVRAKRAASLVLGTTVRMIPRTISVPCPRN